MICHKTFYSERCAAYTGFNKPQRHEQVYIAVSSNAFALNYHSSFGLCISWHQRLPRQQNSLKRQPGFTHVLCSTKFSFTQVHAPGPS